MSPAPDAAVVLAGGSGRRLGGVDKPSLTKDGRSLLDRSLAAVGDIPTVVVGPARSLPPHCRQVRENPPGSGPAAALAAALPLLGELPDRAMVAVLAADLPALDTPVLTRLVAALGGGVGGGLDGRVDGVVLVDPSGRRQYLLGVWRLGALRRATEARPSWTDAALSRMLAPLAVIDIPGDAEETADLDTPEDLRRWLGGTPG